MKGRLAITAIAIALLSLLIAASGVPAENPPDCKTLPDKQQHCQSDGPIPTQGPPDTQTCTAGTYSTLQYTAFDPKANVCHAYMQDYDNCTGAPSGPLERIPADFHRTCTPRLSPRPTALRATVIGQEQAAG